MNDFLYELEKYVESEYQRNTSYRTYTETDAFTFSGQKCFSVLEYWKFVFGNLASQSDTIAEFLVAEALGRKKAENSDYWTAYDLSYRKRRIEVKSTSYVHPYNRKRYSEKRSFSIAPSSNRYWLRKPDDASDDTLSRQSDVYVFCLNTNKELGNIQPLIIDSWEFYVVPTYMIDKYTASRGNPNQKTISLKAVKKLSGGAVCFKEIRDAVDRAITDSDRYYSSSRNTVDSPMLE